MDFITSKPYGIGNKTKQQNTFFFFVLTHREVEINEARTGPHMSLSSAVRQKCFVFRVSSKTKTLCRKYASGTSAKGQ